MSARWRIVKLDEIITFERGLTYAKGDEVAHSSVGVLRSNNVDLTTQSLNLDEIKYLREDFEVPAKKKVRKNTLLMCMSNGSKDHLGKVALIDRDLDYAFGGFMGLLTPDAAIVLPKYLYYALASKSFKDYIHSLADGANINNLKYKDLAAFDILLPSLPEQQRIVDILDREFAKVDALKANAEKSLQAAKDLFQATLKKELGGKTKNLTTLLSICQSIVDCPHSTPIKSPEKTNFPCIRTSELKAGRISWATMQYVSEDEYRKRITRLQPQEGDIVYGREGTIGDAVMLPTGYHFCLGQRTMLFRPNRSLINPKYLLYCVISPFVYNQAMSRNTGCGVAHVNVADVKQFLIPVPEQIDEQRRIVSYLDALNDKCSKLQENYQKTLTLCDDLKQSLLRKAFNGEL